MEKTHGQLAYEAYAAHAGWKSIHGEALPDWGGHAPEIRDHWEAAAWNVAGALRGRNVVVHDQYGRPHELAADNWTKNGDGSITVIHSGTLGAVADFAAGWQAVYHGGVRTGPKPAD